MLNRGKETKVEAKAIVGCFINESIEALERLQSREPDDVFNSALESLRNARERAVGTGIVSLDGQILNVIRRLSEIQKRRNFPAVCSVVGDLKKLKILYHF